MIVDIKIKKIDVDVFAIYREDSERYVLVNHDAVDLIKELEEANGERERNCLYCKYENFFNILKRNGILF